MCQRRPANPTDPGDAADLSIMGIEQAVRRHVLVPEPVLLPVTFAQEY